MMMILIPAAGNGKRFKEAGYKEPKPLINVVGYPMIHQVMRNIRPIGVESEFVLITRKEHGVSNAIKMSHVSVELDHETEGAVATLLEAKGYIAPNDSLLIANCDQLVDFDARDFVNTELDGRIVVFPSSKPHHSYVTVKDGLVTAIAEKEVISNHAVTGVYYFRSAQDFMYAAEKVILNNDRAKGEFYVSTVIDYLLRFGKKLGIYEAPSTMLGTPEELQQFLVAAEVARTL